MLLLTKLIAPYCHWSEHHISWIFATWKCVTLVWLAALFTQGDEWCMVCHNNVTILALCCFNVYIVWVTFFKKPCASLPAVLFIFQNLCDWICGMRWHSGRHTQSWTFGCLQVSSRSFTSAVAHFRVETLTSSIYCTFVNALVWYWWDTCPRFITGYGGADRHCLDWSGWCRCCFSAPIKCCEHVCLLKHMSQLMSQLDSSRFTWCPSWLTPSGMWTCVDPSEDLLCVAGVVCLSLSYVNFRGIWAEHM